MCLGGGLFWYSNMCGDPLHNEGDKFPLTSRESMEHVKPAEWNVKGNHLAAHQRYTVRVDMYRIRLRSEVLST